MAFPWDPITISSSFRPSLDECHGSSCTSLRTENMLFLATCRPTPPCRRPPQQACVVEVDGVVAFGLEEKGAKG